MAYVNLSCGACSIVCCPKKLDTEKKFCRFVSNMIGIALPPVKRKNERNKKKG